MIPETGKITKLVTVEPALLLYCMSLSLVSLGGQNLLLQKVCHPGPEMRTQGVVCEKEKESQRKVADIETWRHIVQLSLPALFVMFAGTWSDNHGKRRKPLLYIPLCGQILADILCLANVYFWEWSSITAAISQVALQSLTGWRCCFFVGVSSYISDITTVESRTSRIGLCTGLFFVGTPLGAVLFGLMFKNLGFYGVYSTTVAMNLIALLYLMTFVDDNHSKDKCETTELSTFKGLLDPSNALAALRVVFKPRENYKRAILILLVLAAPMSVAPLLGEFSVLYFFTRLMFNWDVTQYGYYGAYKTIIICFGMMVSLGLLSRVLSVPDPVIGILASITLMAASAGYAYTSEVWHLFVWPLVDLMHGSTLPIVSSIATKNVDQSELGRVNAAIGMADAIFPLLNMPLYSQVYKYTVRQMPGAIFFISMAYGVAGLAIFSAVHILLKKQKADEKVGEKEDHTHL